MKISCKLTLAIACLISFSTEILGQENALPKRTLKANYELNYLQTPGSVDSFAALLSEGMFYGRLRSNNFYFRWEDEDPTRNTHFIGGLGGSLIYKSSILSGFSFSTGLYYSQGFFDDKEDPILYLKPGKDLISRFNYANTGSKSMAVLGEAYISYLGFEKSSIYLGRQLVETFYTKSNDTKMIPNTFDGLVVDTVALPDTPIRLAYLTHQKLRDHAQNHSILMYGDHNSTTSPFPNWSENDDTAMHRGLTYSRLVAAGVNTEAPLITGDLHNRSIKELKLDGSFYTVPHLLSQVMSEANYRVWFDDTFSITPGIRYIKQFDDGAGEIGGASYFGHLAGLSGAVRGYKDASSLDSQMIAARLVLQYKDYSANLGYTKIFDEADLITPWRSFPTAGYTRSMGRYNWRANTKSYRIAIKHNAKQNSNFQKLYTEISILHVDEDESKNLIAMDYNYYYTGFIKSIPQVKNLQWRLRFGYQDTELKELDNLDSRFELNYLF